MLNDLCDLVSQDKVYCFVARDPRLERVPAIKNKSVVGYKVTKRPIESPYRFPRWFFNKPLSRFIETLKNIDIGVRLTGKIISYGKRHQINCVWAVLQGKTMISVVLPVARKLHVPLVTQIWDDPEWMLTSTGIDPKVKDELLKVFNQTVRKSVACATASWPMAKTYQDKYKIKTVSFLGSLDKKLAKRPAITLRGGQLIKIGFAGQMYAYKEVDAFIHALQSNNWQLGGRYVKMYLLGNANVPKLPKEARQHIKYLGYKSQHQTIGILNRMDILYCPYWTDKNYRKIAETSFPSKLTSYLAAGRPVFFHGPSYSSPSKFIKDNRCGILCHSLKAETIIGRLMLLVISKSKYRNITRAGRVAFNKYLTLNSLGQELDKFLDTAREATIK